MKENKAIISLLEQKKLLQIEYEEEKRLFTKTTEKEGLEKLKNRGNAWVGLKVERTFYNSLNQRVLEVIATNIDDEEDNNFEYGRPVMFFKISSDFSSSIVPLFQGEISYVSGNRMLAVISEKADVSILSEAYTSGVMLSFDETTYKAMFEALDSAINASGRLKELRDLIYSTSSCGTLNLTNIHFPYLNAGQERAVNKILRAKDVAIVHGPPGTGKTTTLIEAIYEILRREPQVLVCAQSNAAVDWISEKLVDRGINVLRIGNPTRVNDKMLSFTYERRFESHPDYTDLWSIRNTIRQLRKNRGKTEAWHQKMDRLKSRATELEIRINNDLFNNASVIASTLTGSANHVLSGMKFPTLVIDEAAQALEAATWIPMKKAGRVILAGDHCQLPPVVKSFVAYKRGLGKSLMEKICENHPEAVELLSMQYRMHQSIMQFSNDWFYNGEMKAASDVRFRGILDFDLPIEWIDTSDVEVISNFVDINEGLEKSFSEKITSNFGKINKNEAFFALQVLQQYIERITVRRILDENIDIGVISPYRAQVQYLRQLIKHTPFFKSIRKNISVNTVDGFQGQERDVILISMVRSNEEGNIGFLNDLRRMNVAMTRARMKLMIIGDKETLSKNKFYRDLYSYVNDLKSMD